MKKLMLIAMLVVVALLSGCETQNQQVWGQGELPTNYQDLFGNSNTARLDFVQTNRINQCWAALYGITAKDLDGAQVRRIGLIEKTTALEDLAERVKKLEDARPEIVSEIPRTADTPFGEGYYWAPQKPYIYNDPYQRDDPAIVFDNVTDTVCTKHGRLKWGETIILSRSNKIYCYVCVSEVAQIYLDKHIGVDPNEN